MADEINNPDSVLGKASDQAMKSIEHELGPQGVYGGNIIVLLTDWNGTKPNSNVSMLGYAGSDEEQARDMIEHLLAAAQNTAEKMGWAIVPLDVGKLH